MPPRRYPNFKKVPHSLADKRELKIANDFRRSFLSHVEPYDFMDNTTPLCPPKRHFVRRFWETRKDYLFMLVFSNLSLYDALSCADMTIKFGGYVVIVYILVSISMTMVISYLVIFVSVYTKKSMLNFGAMIPIFTGFGYILLGLCLLRAILKMRLFMHFLLFAYQSLTQDYSVCPNYNFKHAESNLLNVTCIDVKDEEAVREMHHNSTCTVLENSLQLKCGNSPEKYILSTHVLPSILFYNIQSKYLSLVLALVAYGIVVFLITKEMPSFVKSAEAVTMSFFTLNIIVVVASFFVEGHEKGFNHLFQLREKPSAETVMKVIAVALPKMPELFLTVCAATGRLPLCTTPAIDCVILTFMQICMAVIVSVSNVMMMGVMSHKLDIGFSELGSEFVPFSSVPFFMARMPISERFWTVFYFLVHCIFCFYGVLTILEAIFVNVLWCHGMNKLIITILHVIAFFLVLYFYLLPDEGDINAWYLQNMAINLPLLVLFCAAIFIYGTFKLEEDIAFMTSSPPAEIMSRLIRLLPLLCIILLVWGYFYVYDLLDLFLLFSIIFCVAGEAVVRLLLSDDLDSQIRPTPSFGPPNPTLRNERKDYNLETKRVSTSSANRAVYLFNKASAASDRHDFSTT